MQYIKNLLRYFRIKIDFGILKYIVAVHKLCCLEGGEGVSPKDDLLHRPYLIKKTTKGGGRGLKTMAPYWRIPFFFSFHLNDQEDVCSNWILLYLHDIGIPLLAIVGFACMILRSNGKDMYREIWFPFLLKHTSTEINQAFEYSHWRLFILCKMNP